MRTGEVADVRGGRDSIRRSESGNVSRWCVAPPHGSDRAFCLGRYYFTAKFGFAFTLQPGSVSTLWLPNSILLAALLLTPRRSWWIVLLAALPAHFAAELQSGVPATMALSWFVSNSVQALIGAVSINALVDAPLRFDSFRHLTILLFLGAFLAPFLSSFLDIALLKLNGWGYSSYWENWRIRFLSNVLATLTLVRWLSRGPLAVSRLHSLHR